MTATGNGHRRAATSARRRERWGNARPGQEPIAALTPDLGPLPPIPVTLGAVLATVRFLSCKPCSVPSPDCDR